MSEAVKDYIDKAREAGAGDQDILDMMVKAGWDKAVVEAALKGVSLPPPPPPPPSATTAPAPATAPVAPIAVVTSLSTRGFEYWIMFLALGITASALGWVLHSLTDGAFSGGGGFYEAGVSFASAALIVALPVFAFMFLRLKKAELAEPSLHNDASRRRAIQLTLIITFLIGISKIIWYMYSLFNGNANAASEAASPGINLVHSIITIGIAGGIFAYYWRDQHKKV